MKNYIGILVLLIVFAACKKDEELINADKDQELTELSLKNGQNPRNLLISETSGKLWILNLQTNILTQFHHLEDWGNFDIQYTNPFEIILANWDNRRIDKISLPTKKLQAVYEGHPLSRPIGLAVSPGNDIYIADWGNGKVYTLNSRTSTLDLLAEEDPYGNPFNHPDGIVVDPGGKNVYISDQTPNIYRITLQDKTIEKIATINEGSLNGMAFLSPQFLVAVSIMNPPALFKVDVNTGDVITLYEGEPFRNPEDVAIDPQGKNIYIVDSDINNNNTDDYRPAIYVFNIQNESLTELLAGDPLGDIVDLLLEPFTGFN